VNVSVAFYHDMHTELFVPEQDICALEYPPDTSDVSPCHLCLWPITAIGSHGCQNMISMARSDDHMTCGWPQQIQINPFAATKEGDVWQLKVKAGYKVVRVAVV
jgi:hypothetical protein